jgi:uncharacterized protein YdhG (YjbR/CyaY superfamily)
MATPAPASAAPTSIDEYIETFPPEIQSILQEIRSTIRKAVRDPAIEKAIAPYAGPKGNLQFPLDHPIPYDLIARIVNLRVKQNQAKACAKATISRR